MSGKYIDFRKKLSDREQKVFDELVIRHRSNCCGCNLANDEDIYMCPIGLWEDGCLDNDLLIEIRDIVESEREGGE